MKKSITVTVTPVNGSLSVQGKGLQHEYNYRPFFRSRIRTLPYRVTYSVDKKGAYNVSCSEREYRPYIRHEGRGFFVVCFLPRSWNGLRVSRRVEKVKK